ncbi:MAG: hypothetical protein SGJ20_04940 [Planctomycetota bacterium]|nr:hypothetical protein [Planctomycetota bacterium]
MHNVFGLIAVQLCQLLAGCVNQPWTRTLRHVQERLSGDPSFEYRVRVKSHQSSAGTPGYRFSMSEKVDNSGGDVGIWINSQLEMLTAITPQAPRWRATAI